MIVLGIDPGLDGALVWLDIKSGNVVAVDMPTLSTKKGKKVHREIDAQQLADAVRCCKCQHAVVEKVHAMPKQGVTSVFSFGRSAGIIEGVLAALEIPRTYVTPAQWTREVRTMPGKDGSRKRAQELVPAFSHLFSRVKDDGRADAMLIAYWWATMRVQA
jgi:crossover junction endodeoxyribonuclease RuvC